VAVYDGGCFRKSRSFTQVDLLRIIVEAVRIKLEISKKGIRLDAICAGSCR